MFVSVDMGFEVVKNSSGRVITVGHYKEYPTIQQGIDAASDGDTVMVYTEDYYETVVVDKSIDLISVGAGIWGTYPGMPDKPMLQDNLITITANYVNISGFDIYYSEYAGIEVWSNYNNISNNNLLETADGSVILHGDYNNVERNSMKDGMRLYNSCYNIIMDNDISDTLTEDGIILYSSNNNYIEHNIIGNNIWGVYLEESQNNSIKNNLVSYCGYNKYGEDGYGISLWSSHDNEIYHNDIIDNINQAYDDNPGNNFWDNGYPDGGNSWSDYNGVDNYSGPNQDIPGSDGIGDTNYTINSKAVDNYPLMGRHTDLVGSCSPPKANAGPDQTVYVKETVQLDGSRSKDSDGYISTYEWDFDDGSPFGYRIILTHVYDKPGIYYVTLTVMDDDGITDSDICEITVIATPVSIHLNHGLNLISLPTIQIDTDIQSVLQSMEGEYDSLQWYDASDSRDPWKHYHVSKPSYLNDLSEINHEMGFWIFVTREGGTALSLEGDRPTTPRFLNLHFGWNLVGYPSNISMQRDEALNTLFFGSDVDAVQYYDTSEGKLKTLEENDLMEPGKGYYIHAQTDCVWEVPL
jgi:parallel beta-helix repeat protein